MQLLLSSICMALTSAVVGNAWYQKKQFYPAVVYITKSNASMAVIYIQFFNIVFMFGKLLRKIFLGTLRAAEFELLLERFWYALTETCLAFTVFRDDFNPRFVALFTVLLFLKSFHWLAEERVDFMERSPVLGWLFHIRVASLLTVLGSLDYMLLMHAYNSTLSRGPTVQLVFGFEYAILLTVVASTTIKYVLHGAEMRTDTPWENKAVFLLYTELFIGFIKVVLYVLFVVIMAKFYALPMFVFRPMFFTIRNFKKALSDVIMSRRAIRNMNTLYPDATAEELRLSDNICIICREDMINHSKKLPCGHIFHTTCLRSWFQRQQTCPTCRLNILRAPAANSTALPRQDDVAAANAGVAGVGAGAAAVPNVVPGATTNVNAAAAAGTGASGVAPAAGADGTAVPPPNLTFEQILANAGIPTGIPTTSTVPNPTGGAGFPGMPFVPMIPPPPFMMPPPFHFIAPYAVPPPPMPPDLTNFTDEELKALEGNERKNIEERVKLLGNIKLMLDAANILISNYQIVSNRSQQTLTKPSSSSSNETTTNAQETSAATATSASAAAASTTSATSTTKEPNADLPSTSAAAAAAAVAAAETATVLQKASTFLNTDSNANAPATNSMEKVNQVTIEDLGGEDHVDLPTLANDAAAAAVTTIDSAAAEHMNELRKRRLKFLEERNKTTSTD